MWSLCLYYSCCLMQQATKYKYKYKGSPAIKYNQRCRLGNRNEYLHFLIFAIIIEDARCPSVLIIMIRTHHQGHDLPAHILKRARICETHICINVTNVNHKTWKITAKVQRFEEPEDARDKDKRAAFILTVRQLENVPLLFLIIICINIMDVIPFPGDQMPKRGCHAITHPQKHFYQFVLRFSDFPISFTFHA